MGREEGDLEQIQFTYKNPGFCNCWWGGISKHPWGSCQGLGFPEVLRNSSQSQGTWASNPGRLPANRGLSRRQDGRPVCASAGSRGRSPSVSGDAVKVPPPPWSSAPGGSPPLRGRPWSPANLPDPGQPPSPPGRPWPREEGRPPRRSRDRRAAGRAAVASRNVWDPKAEATARDEPPFRSSAPG